MNEKVLLPIIPNFAREKIKVKVHCLNEYKIYLHKSVPNLLCLQMKTKQIYIVSLLMFIANNERAILYIHMEIKKNQS